MNFVELSAVVAGLTLVGLLLTWWRQYGALRAFLIVGLRIGWIIPLFLAFFPQSRQQELPRSQSLTPINVLIDDSESMRHQGFDQESRAVVARLQKECDRLGCRIQTTSLSELAPEVEQGFTPLSDVLMPWLTQTGSDPWVVFADGGDWRPTVPWSPELRQLGASLAGQAAPRGAITAFAPKDAFNIWLDNVDAPPFAFEGQPSVLRAELRRSGRSESSQRVQLQVAIEGRSVASVNAVIREGEDGVVIPISLPALARGQHLLTIQAVPTPDESAHWDNRLHAQIEVLPNTIGILHLLGSPSWDGRFLRRYLKSEPKYDTISFFILRDRWDSQAVSERELSLIPFPVDRLFNEELPNFRVVVVQNFALFEFLQPEYQMNLVNFVRDGGSLLFLGGPRALQGGDLASQSLGSILPFEPPREALANTLFSGGHPFGRSSNDQVGPFYDASQRFRIKVAQPDDHRRELANVIDDWLPMQAEFDRLDWLTGLHRMDQVDFKDEVFTPLLNAETPDGRTFPLAVASYPGKGRAIWLFTDQLWRMAMASPEDLSRVAYHEFVQAGMNWLLRQEFRKPLIIRNFDLHGHRGAQIEWHAYLHGPAARYFQTDEGWTIRVCGMQVTDEQVTVDRLGEEQWRIGGRLRMFLDGGERCSLEIRGEHAAFGSLEANLTTVFPETFSDTQVGAAPQRMQQLASLTGGLYVAANERERDLLAWLGDVTQDGGVALPSRHRTVQDHYWVLDTWWIYILLILIPAEVVVRRWNEIFGIA